MSANFVARRYLTFHRGNSYMSWITFLSVAGIAIGVAAMIVVLSVINGFESELRKKFLAANAHILAFQYPSGFSNVSATMNIIEGDFGKEITGMSPFVHSETMATNDSLMHNVLVRGVDPELRRNVQEMDSVVRPISALGVLAERMAKPELRTATEPPPLILGSGLASILNLKVGDLVKLVRPESNTLGQLKAYKIIGFYDSGLKHYDNRIALMSLPDAQELFKMGDRVHGLEIGLIHPDQSVDVANRMSNRYTLTIKDWQSFNKAMFDVMEMERSVIGLIVALVAFVASFNILTTLFITVTQKQRSISILKALGAGTTKVLGIFVLQGLYIGIIGSVLGAALAVVISQLLQRYEFVELPDLYQLARLPIVYDPQIYLNTCLAGVGICLVAGIYPAWIAARTNIVDGFKGRQGAA